MKLAQRASVLIMYISMTTVLEKLENNCVESVSTAITLCSGEAVFCALQQAAAGALQTRHISTAGDGQCERLREMIAQQQSGFGRDAVQAN